jgi:hypothetical protein
LRPAERGFGLSQKLIFTQRTAAPVAAGIHAMASQRDDYCGSCSAKSTGDSTIRMVAKHAASFEAEQLWVGLNWIQLHSDGCQACSVI